MDWGRSEGKLRALAAQGLSARQIALQLGGVTRNAVIGQMKRRGISLAGNRGGQHDTVQALPEPTPEPEPVREPAPPPEPVAEPSVEPVSTLELRRGQCRWPLNDGVPEWTHCGARATRGPYCDHHRERAFSKASPRRVA